MSCSTGSCKTGGCGALSVHDWLDNMLPPGVPEARNIYEVKFKATRKGYYRNFNSLDLTTGDYVVVESERGWDVGTVSMGGELVRLQMKKKKVDEKSIQGIIRVADAHDVEMFELCRRRDHETMVRARAVIATLNLDMKLTEVEYQVDQTKATFYYTAETRVDFRELIKILAQEFRIRVEMRQIGLRQEAAIVGGVGTCGRQLCCSSWLTDFKSVGTGAARYQNISLNPAKITGQCGRLKCCLNYELETYMEALRDIPQVNQIDTETGTAYLQKTDIFKRRMWFSFGGDSNWVGLDVERVLELIAMNKKGVRPPALLAEEEIENQRRKAAEARAADFVDVVGQSNLHERPLPKNSKKKKKKGEQRPQPVVAGAKMRGGGGPGGQLRSNRADNPYAEPTPAPQARGARPEGGEALPQPPRPENTGAPRAPRPEGAAPAGPKPGGGGGRIPRPEGGGNQNRQPRNQRPDNRPPRGPRPDGAHEGGAPQQPPRIENSGAPRPEGAAPQAGPKPGGGGGRIPREGGNRDNRGGRGGRNNRGGGGGPRGNRPPSDGAVSGGGD